MPFFLIVVYTQTKKMSCVRYYDTFGEEIKKSIENVGNQRNKVEEDLQKNK